MGFFNLFRKPQAPSGFPSPHHRKELGALGEKIACDYLKKQHYQVIETNYRDKLGEIDIIALHKKQLVFLEVRTKTSSSFGLPEESITLVKKRRLVSLALNYLQTHHDLPPEWRIDVVAVELNREGRLKRVEIIENAVV
jgi:putative endonuclease